MKECIYLNEQGDDKYSGLSEKTAVRTVARAVKIANRTGRDIKLLGEAKRFTEELEREPEQCQKSRTQGCRAGVHAVERLMDHETSRGVGSF